MNGLIGSKIRIFSKGGWELEGEVIKEDKSKIILNNKNIFFIYKDSISIIEFIKADEVSRPVGSQSRNEPKEEPLFPQNSLSYTDYQVGLPESLLVKEKGSSFDDDLSISLPKVNANNKISFGVKNNEQKVREDKAKDS